LVLGNPEVDVVDPDKRPSREVGKADSSRHVRPPEDEAISIGANEGEEESSPKR
jgi:hypothetical protein